MTAALGRAPEALFPFEITHAHEKLEGQISTIWDSRYFLEGRDMLDGDSLWESSVEFGWKHFAGGVWYGYSPETQYDEMQLSAAWTGCAGDFEFYAGYTHLQFFEDDARDNEIGAGLTWSGLPMEWVLGVDSYYSLNAEGMFCEASVTREFQITDRLCFSLSGAFGLNFGYVSDGHDGANHTALRLSVAYALADSLSLIAHAVSSWALDKDADAPGDAQLKDFVHSGIGLQWSF